MILMVSKFSIPASQKGGIIYVFLIVFLDWAIRKNERLKSKFFFEKDIVFNPKSEKSYLFLAKIYQENGKNMKNRKLKNN